MLDNPETRGGQPEVSGDGQTFQRPSGLCSRCSSCTSGADRKIVANCLDPEETRVAIIEDGRLADLFVERMWERQKTGEIYKARVESVLPGIHAAFVNLGDGRNAFLYLNDARGLDLQPNNELVVQEIGRASCRERV